MILRCAQAKACLSRFQYSFPVAALQKPVNIVQADAVYGISDNLYENRTFNLLVNITDFFARSLAKNLACNTP
jgi:hypothetical protein